MNRPTAHFWLQHHKSQCEPMFQVLQSARRSSTAEPLLLPAPNSSCWILIYQPGPVCCGNRVSAPLMSNAFDRSETSAFVGSPVITESGGDTREVPTEAIRPCRAKLSQGCTDIAILRRLTPFRPASFAVPACPGECRLPFGI